MTRFIRTALVVLIFASANIQAASAQQPVTTGDQESNLQVYAELLRVDVRGQKMSIITDMMGFTPAEAAEFWPIYAEYDRELTALGDQRVALIEDYAAQYETMTDEGAADLATRALDLESMRTDVKRRYFNRFADALSGRAAARFLQVENQLLMIIDLRIASNLPVLQ